MDMESLVFREGEDFLDLADFLETLLSLRFRRMMSEATVMDVTQTKELIRTESMALQDRMDKMEKHVEEQLGRCVKALEMLRVPRGEPQPSGLHVMSRIEAQDTRVGELQEDIAILGDMVLDAMSKQSVLGWDSEMSRPGSRGMLAR